MHVEFRKMAKESGIRELMRVSNIISDNIRKGVELTGKLTGLRANCCGSAERRAVRKRGGLQRRS